MDSSQSQPSGSDSSRLRRERREAKIKAGGSSRLDKITQLSGRPVEPSSDDTSFSHTTPTTQDNASTPDPDEIDITNQPYSSRSLPQKNTRPSVDGPTEADIRALLRSDVSQPSKEAGPRQSQQQEEDPMMHLLQQMMGGTGSEPGAEGVAGLPPGLAAMLGGIGGGGGGLPSMEGFGQQREEGSSTTVERYAYIWRMLHALYATILGIYLVSHTSFTSSSVRLTPGRSTAPPPASSASGVVESGQPAVSMFWIFATAELVLQGSRFLLEQGKDRSQGGWLQLIGGVLPEPWKGRARLVGQYSGIWNTLAEDAMVVVFMLGIVGWWRGFEG